MKDFDGLILCVFCVTVACLLFLGFKSFMKKSIKLAPPIKTDHQQLYLDNKRKMDAERRMQEKMLRDQKQRMKDMQRMQKMQTF